MKSVFIGCAVAGLVSAAAAQTPSASPYTASVTVQYWSQAAGGARTKVAEESGTLERWADGTMLRAMQRHEGGRSTSLPSLLRLPDGSAFQLNASRRIALESAPPGPWPPPAPAGAKAASWNSTPCLLGPDRVLELRDGKYVPLASPAPSFICYSPHYAAVVHSEIWSHSPTGGLLETIEDTFNFAEKPSSTSAPRVPSAFTILHPSRGGPSGVPQPR